MGKQFEKKLRKQFQRWGVYFERYPKKKELKKEHPEVQRFVLKRLARQLKSSNNHKAYNKFLKQWVPEWDMKIKNAVFTKRGLGHSNLNMHRRVRTTENVLFEKVYFSFEPDLHNVEWFYDHAARLTEQKIKIPKIVKMYRDDVLTIIYYEFLDLQPIGPKDREAALIKFSKELYTIFNENTAYFSKLHVPDEMKKVLGSSRYKKFKMAAGGKLQKHGLDIDYIHQAVLSSKHILAHGHISKANSFQDSVLVDWDTVCYYPIGFDPAKIYYFFLKKNKTDGEFLKWLRQHYKSVIKDEEWEVFVHNAFYFMLIFGQRRIFERGKHLSVEEQLIEKLRQFFPNSVLGEPTSKLRDTEVG